LSGGDLVRIQKTNNYDGYYTLDATTSANELVIAKTYAAETFVGDEIVSTNSASGVKLIGGRHVATVNPCVGYTRTTGTLVLNGYSDYAMIYEDLGRLTVNEIAVRSGGGIGIGGGTPNANALNFGTATNPYLGVGGTTYLLFDKTAQVLNLYRATKVQNTAATLYAGTGSPEGAVTAAVGSLYLRTDGGTGTTLYVKETGSGNTGWAAK
jgi:hypothetical protein